MGSSAARVDDPMTAIRLRDHGDSLRSSRLCDRKSTEAHVDATIAAKGCAKKVMETSNPTNHAFGAAFAAAAIVILARMKPRASGRSNVMNATGKMATARPTTLPSRPTSEDREVTQCSEIPAAKSPTKRLKIVPAYALRGNTETYPAKSSGMSGV